MSVERPCSSRLYPVVQLHDATEQPGPPADRTSTEGFITQASLPVFLGSLMDRSWIAQTSRAKCKRWHVTDVNRFNEKSGDHPAKRDSPDNGLVLLPHLPAAGTREREIERETTADIPSIGTRILPFPAQF